MRRREERAAAARVPPARTGPPGRATPTDGDVWRRGSAGAAIATPPRSGANSPRPAPESPSGLPRTRPSMFASKPTEGGWREREAAKKVAGATAGGEPRAATATMAAGNREAGGSTSASASAPAEGGASAADNDGFQTVPKKAVWRPSRGRGI